MQCSLTIEPHYDLPQDNALRPFGDAAQVISSITAHPGLTDAWGPFVSLIISAAAALGAGIVSGGSLAAAVGAATLKWVSDELKSGDNPTYGKVANITFPSGALYWCASQARPMMDWGDQLRVSFRAWSEDEIKQGADAHVEQPPGINAGIVDQGGGYHQTSGTYFYDRSVLVPLRTLPVGIYSISFTAEDDGWFDDVGVSEVLFIKVDENQHPRPPAQPAPVTIVPPTAAEMNRLLGILDDARSNLEVLPTNVAPKRRSARLDGRAPIPLEVAAAIPFQGQKPSPTPNERAATMLW